MSILLNGSPIDLISADPSFNSLKRAADFLESHSYPKPYQILIDSRMPLELLAIIEGIEFLSAAKVHVKSSDGFSIWGEGYNWEEKI